MQTADVLAKLPVRRLALTIEQRTDMALPSPTPLGNFRLREAGVDEFLNDCFPVHGETIPHLRYLCNRQCEDILHKNCDMDNLQNRLKETRNAAGLTQKQLAKKAGISQTTISDIERGRNQGSTEMPMIAAALGVNALWLSDKKGDKFPRKSQEVSIDDDSDHVTIKKVEFKLSAGVTGYAIEYLNGTKKSIVFRKDWLAERGFNPDKLFAVPVSGQSMETSLYDDDLVVVNTDDIKPIDGEVYAANYEGELVIKRLKRESGEWFLASDNPDKRRYPDKRCNDDCNLIGKIIYKQSERI